MTSMTSEVNEKKLSDWSILKAPCHRVDSLLPVSYLKNHRDDSIIKRMRIHTIIGVKSQDVDEVSKV